MCKEAFKEDPLKLEFIPEKFLLLQQNRSKTVEEFKKKIAKKRGFHGYNRLRKAELIELLNKKR